MYSHTPLRPLHPAGNGWCMLTGVPEGSLTNAPRPWTGARVMRMMVAEASASDVTIVPDATTGANSAGAFLAPRAQGRTHSTNQRKRSRRTTHRCPPPHLPQLPCGPCGCRRDRVPHVLACPHARSLSPDQLGPRSASSAHARNANHCPRRRPSCSRTGCSRCAGLCTACRCACVPTRGRRSWSVVAKGGGCVTRRPCCTRVSLLLQHFTHPYPTDAEKQQLMVTTGLSKDQGTSRLRASEALRCGCF